jgi:hypothetical protein
MQNQCPRPGEAGNPHGTAAKPQTDAWEAEDGLAHHLLPGPVNTLRPGQTRVPRGSQPCIPQA